MRKVRLLQRRDNVAYEERLIVTNANLRLLQRRDNVAYEVRLIVTNETLSQET